MGTEMRKKEQDEREKERESERERERESESVCVKLCVWCLPGIEYQFPHNKL